MKATIELNLEAGVYGITYQLPGKTELHGRGKFAKHPDENETIASGYKEASWMLTASILNDLGNETE